MIQNSCHSGKNGKTITNWKHKTLSLMWQERIALTG
ncbi:Uncharacterised protein [Vibrio cholerae]|nr:Uncharacterised protein [Vibrio cholerae]